MTPRVLIVDDEPDIRATVEILLSRAGLDSEAASSVRSALAMLDESSFDVVLTDMRLDDGTGLDVVRWVAEHRPATPVAVITAYGSAKDAVTALKAGAFDYVEKPVDTALLRRVVHDALQLSDKSLPSPSIRTDAPNPQSALVGQSPAMAQLRATLGKLARTQAPVYIHGESGVGKELVAREIHRLSPRKQEPFIAINCGAIPSELFESELFGHIKGSFSGAHSDREGLFVAADGGTLFLDEVVDLPLSMQVKLLRALQERRIRPVGANKEIAVDVRVLAASQYPLEQAVASGKFREDLFYRLNVIALPIPPLRERQQDIESLAVSLTRKISERHHQTPPTLSPAAIANLQNRPFPGNVRELENTLERAFALQDNPAIIDVADLPPAAEIHAHAPLNLAESHSSPEEPAPISRPQIAPSAMSIDAELAQSEERRILQALEATRWNRTQAAKLLGISFRSLRYRLKKLGIDEK